MFNNFCKNLKGYISPEDIIEYAEFMAQDRSFEEMGYKKLGNILEHLAECDECNDKVDEYIALFREESARNLLSDIRKVGMINIEKDVLAPAEAKLLGHIIEKAEEAKKWLRENTDKITALFNNMINEKIWKLNYADGALLGAPENPTDEDNVSSEVYDQNFNLTGKVNIKVINPPGITDLGAFEAKFSSSDKTLEGKTIYLSLLIPGITPGEEPLSFQTSFKPSDKGDFEANFISEEELFEVPGVVIPVTRYGSEKDWILRIISDI
ncbi:MAG: hypothetical protein ABRQ37_09745 [Candidatus Eremiobacterota bacterium]